MDFININQQLINANNIMQENDVKGTFAMFGSARISEKSEEYKRAKAVAKAISEALPQFHICSGGGPGLMRAFNEGATTPSIGMGITLPFESGMNEFVDIAIEFEHFFIRKYWFTHSAKAFICFEGGIGTLDEFYEVLVLKQTKKIDDVPIILVGEEYWSKAINLEYLAEQGLMSKDDLKAIIITNDIDTIVKHLKEKIID